MWNWGKLGYADIEIEEGEWAFMGKHDALTTQSIEQSHFPLIVNNEEKMLRC